MNSIKTESKIISLLMAVALVLAMFGGMCISVNAAASLGSSEAPNPRWDGDTGIAEWTNWPRQVAQNIENSESYAWRLYRNDTGDFPNSEDEWIDSGIVHNPDYPDSYSTFSIDLSSNFTVAGYYYFAVTAIGEGSNRAPFAVSGAFHYTLPGRRGSGGSCFLSSNSCPRWLMRLSSPVERFLSTRPSRVIFCTCLSRFSKYLAMLSPPIFANKKARVLLRASLPVNYSIFLL